MPVSAYRKSFTKESKILLLGGEGYIGTHLFQKLNTQGFSRVYSGSRSAKNPSSLKINIENPSDVDQIRDAKFDVMINLTGQITRPIESCLIQNTVGIQHLVSACADSAVLIQLSSVGVYGSGDWAEENYPCNPETPYSTLKLVAERLILNGLPEERRLILRLSNIYGSTQPKGVFAYLKRAAGSDRILDFNNDGSLLRFFLHVEDLCQALVEVLGNFDKIKEPTLNIIGKDRYTLHQLIDLFEEKFKVKYQRNFEAKKPYDNMLSISDDRFRNLTNFEEMFTLESYVHELVNYAH